MLSNEIKAALWHSYPEQPNPDKLILLVFNKINYDIGYYKSISQGYRFVYLEDILLDDMIDALHKYEKELDEKFY